MPNVAGAIAYLKSSRPGWPRPENANTPMIGLTGLRNVGKSTVANFLESNYGFTRVHAFESGKAAAVTYFESIGCEEPWEMVYGDLKDRPCEFLPGNVAPRFFLEKFGKFMGVDMGIDWTLGAEVRKARSAGQPIVVESLVYEADWFKVQGGIVWRLERPGHVGPVGAQSDAVQALVAADVLLSARSVDELLASARRAVEQIVGGGDHQPRRIAQR